MRKLLYACLLFYGTAAQAATEKPPEIASVIRTQSAYGEGTYSWMWIKAYDASLWTDAPTWSMDVTFALTLHYRMHFTPKELADRSIEEMQHIAPLQESETVDYRAQLLALFHEVKDGDSITALYIPHEGARFFYNGKSTGRIADDVLARRFLDIWLSEKTSAPNLRKQLLSSSGQQGSTY